MTTNLLADEWTNLDSTELRLLLSERIAGPGQYDGQCNNKLHLPLAGPSCRIVLVFKGSRIDRVERGLAFDASEWDRIRVEIETLILGDPIKIGREYSFSSFRVLGSWRGSRSRVQILQPPDDAPRPTCEMAQHPFILEVPITANDLWPITNHRRLREHRKLTLLLNLFLAGRTSLQPRRSKHFWAAVPGDNKPNDIKWVQQFYFADFGKAVIDEPSSFVGEQLEEVEPEEYYASVGHDGKGLRVPSDLDDSICRYLHLSAMNRAKFDRAAFWMDMASTQWTISVSTSFAALVSAIESLTDRGTTHSVYCDKCERDATHEAPGATERFRDFFEQYAPGKSLKKRRSEMYSLRSGILHGSDLMQLDQDMAFGGLWDPPWWNEHKLHEELWGLTRVAIRNWLKIPPTA